MTRAKPGTLAIRAVNQYRRRDVVTYLALRYYLDNSAAITDAWTRDVATELVLTRNEAGYLPVPHFKDILHTGEVEHRSICLPGANEALAEAALLEACGQIPDVYRNPPCVFSYNIATAHDRSGLYEHYMIGLQSRHSQIANACSDDASGSVSYTDIKRFYPSIKPEHALHAWRSYAASAKLNARYASLGEKLIGDQASCYEQGYEGVLTGPMFSHLIGNLVLRELDIFAANSLPARYFRYVDDIVLVGSDYQIRDSLSQIRTRLQNLGLQLHSEESPKTVQVSADEWLSSASDFAQDRSFPSWMTLIADLKRYLWLQQDDAEELHKAFLREGYRIPVRDYGIIIRETHFLQRSMELAKYYWFRRRVRRITIDYVMKQARTLRARYEQEFWQLIEDIQDASSFQRRRRIPRLRFCVGRLIYLATEDTLFKVGAASQDVKELALHSRVALAVSTGNLDYVLNMGTNAAQAAAQPMKAVEKRATVNTSMLNEIEAQALAIFLLNGVVVERLPNLPDSALADIAIRAGTENLFHSEDLYVREFACLHGRSAQPRHCGVLEAVFDEDEELVMDAIDQIEESLVS